MSVRVIRPSSHEAWLEARKGGIGSSEVATIIGLNPFETPYQLWRRKKGLDAPQEETFVMKAGHYLEDAVSCFWQDATGRKVIKSSRGDWFFADSEKPFLQVSPDRTFWVDKHEKGILECKTTQCTIDNDDIPKHWFCQLQYQLGVADLRHGSLAWLTQGRTFGYNDYTLNPEFYEYLKGEVTRFWQDNILGNQEPICSDVEDIQLKYPNSLQGKSKEADDETYKRYLDLLVANGELDEQTKKVNALKDALKMVFDDAEVLTYEGRPLATWKSSKDKLVFDSKAFVEDHPDEAQKYMISKAGSRVFLIK